jgi:hypothetical protein
VRTWFEAQLTSICEEIPVASTRDPAAPVRLFPWLGVFALPSTHTQSIHRRACPGGSTFLPYRVHAPKAFAAGLARASPAANRMDACSIPRSAETPIHRGKPGGELYGRLLAFT